MRTVTVDTKGLFFTTKVVVAVALLAVGWNTWNPLTHFVRSEIEQDAAVANASNLNEGVEESYVFPSASEPPQGNYLFVDAEDMTVTMYTGSEEVGTVSIAHVPHRESPDALVAGSYTIDDVRDVEVSTVTLVRYPYYVRFGDRFALHGTPTDRQDIPLPDDYAGNSILLSFDDARTVREFAHDGMIVYVNAPLPEAPDTTTEFVYTNDDLPATSASAYAVGDMESGQVYLAQGGDKRYPIASITKLVTAAVASDIIGHGEELRAPNGEHYTLGDLFYPLLLRSDNDIAKRIASHVGEAEFIAHMNAYVRAHNMSGTSFRDSSGLSPRDISTANDLLQLARHLYDTKEYILAMTQEAEVTITSTEGNDRLVVNQNKLADDPHFRGGKLGYTDEAGQTSLAVFNVPVGGETRPVAVIVLGSKDWKQDTRTLLRWLVDSTGE